jgi:RNA polymerase sigma-70 factor (ECF subfamily)
VDPVEFHTQLHDADLVACAQRGEATAFAVLVARYQDRVFNACYRMCHNHADALDLTQSAFLRALEALPQFEARSNFYTWLFRIAVNLAASQRRRERRRERRRWESEATRAGGSEPATGPEEDPAERVAETEALGTLEEALGRLEDEYRVAVVLKDIEEMDYATIAEILEVPVGTVKSRIHRGRARLRELLTAKEPERGRVRT